MISPRIGLLLHFDFGEERPADFRTYLYQVLRLIESLPLQAAYIPTEIGWTRLSPLTLLGVAAAWTSRIRVGTCALVLPLFDPLAVAEAVTAAQMVAPGRIVLGVGMGWRREEFEAAGIPLSSRGGRFMEHLEALPSLLRGERPNIVGRHFKLDNGYAALASGLPHVPLWIGAHVPAAIDRAARFGDAWIAGSFSTRAQLARQVRRYREAADRTSKRPGAMVLMRDCIIAETQAGAMVHAPYLQAKYREYSQKIPGMPFDTTLPFRELADERLVVGDPDKCAEELWQFAALTGADELILRLHFRGMDPDEALRSIALLGQEVVPRLRKLSDSTPGLAQIH